MRYIRENVTSANAERERYRAKRSKATAFLHICEVAALWTRSGCFIHTKCVLHSHEVTASFAAKRL